MFEYLVLREWCYFRRIRGCGLDEVGETLLEEVCY